MLCDVLLFDCLLVCCVNVLLVRYAHVVFYRPLSREPVGVLPVQVPDVLDGVVAVLYL